MWYIAFPKWALDLTQRKYHSLVIHVLALLPSGCGLIAPVVVNRDFSEFESFGFRYQPLLDRSLGLDDVLELAIRVEDEQYFVSVGVIGIGDAGDDGCIESTELLDDAGEPIEDACPMVRQLGERGLSAVEVETVRRFFAEIHLDLSPDFPFFVIVDPGAIGFFTWDAFTVTTHPQITPHIEADATLVELFAFLDSLRDGYAN